MTSMGMVKFLIRPSLALLAVALVAPMIAQEGHPLRGSWIGVWQSNAQHGDDVLVVLDWDGERISGIINPGTDNMEIGQATLNPDDWSVHIEADAKDAQGGALRYVIDGTIQDLELPNRYIEGTWKSQQGGGRFEMRRQ